MHYWLFKTEPDEFGIEHLAKSPQQTARWDGIRNYQARNFLRDQVVLGDTVFIYHGKIKQAGIYGHATIVKAAYPDPAQYNPESHYYDSKSPAENPRWFCVDIQLEQKYASPILLEWIKQQPALEQMVLLKQGRLSVQPVSKPEAKILIQFLKL